MRTRNLILFFAVVLVLAWALPVQAQTPWGIGQNPDAVPTIENYSESGPLAFTWDVGHGGFQGIYLDPNAGPWVKNLIPNAPGFGPGIMCTLVEPLTVSGSPDGTLAIPWSDYHEYFVDPSFTWMPAPLTCTGVPDGTKWTAVLGGQVGQNWLTIDWTFSPALPIGTNITLTKTFMWMGGAVAPASVQVWQYPTPEPSTLVLLAVGAISAFGYGFWRRRKLA